MVEGGQGENTGSKSWESRRNGAKHTNAQTGWRQELRKERGGAHRHRAGTRQCPASQGQEASSELADRDHVPP